MPGLGPTTHTLVPDLQLGALTGDKLKRLLSAMDSAWPKNSQYFVPPDACTIGRRGEAVVIAFESDHLSRLGLKVDSVAEKFRQAFARADFVNGTSLGVEFKAEVDPPGSAAAHKEARIVIPVSALDTARIVRWDEVVTMFRRLEVHLGPTFWSEEDPEDNSIWIRREKPKGLEEWVSVMDCFRDIGLWQRGRMLYPPRGGPDKTDGLGWRFDDILRSTSDFVMRKVPDQLLDETAVTALTAHLRAGIHAEVQRDIFFHKDIWRSVNMRVFADKHDSTWIGGHTFLIEFAPARGTMNVGAIFQAVKDLFCRAGIDFDDVSNRDPTTKSERPRLRIHNPCTPGMVKLIAKGSALLGRS